MQSGNRAIVEECAKTLRMTIGLGLLFLTVLLGPVLIKPIERNVELFFLLVGVATAYIMGQFNATLVWAALREPVSFTAAVLIFGATFRLLRDYLDQLLRQMIRLLEPRLLCFCLVIILGFFAAVITPVVSALVFVEAISLLRCDRWVEIVATVFACFAIGFGAGLTPLGMPGIAVVLRALHTDFWYLAHLLGAFIVVGIILAAVLTLFLPFASGEGLDAPEEKDSWRLVLLIRPGKVYVFIGGLVALSDGLRPVVEAYIHRLPIALLFWMNTISAVVNNSTLAAVEIGPSLSSNQQRAAFLGLLISGGALVTGNIPNIVAASRLGITSREWARVGLIVGLPLMLLCFAVLRWIG
jgi:predicted cation transporter